MQDVFIYNILEYLVVSNLIRMSIVNRDTYKRVYYLISENSYRSLELCRLSEIRYIAPIWIQRHMDYKYRDNICLKSDLTHEFIEKRVTISNLNKLEDIPESIAEKYLEHIDHNKLLTRESISLEFLQRHNLIPDKYPCTLYGHIPKSEYLFHLFESEYMKLDQSILCSVTKATRRYVAQKYRGTIPKRILFCLLHHHDIECKDLHLYKEYKNDLNISTLMKTYPTKYYNQL